MVLIYDFKGIQWPILDVSGFKFTDLQAASLTRPELERVLSHCTTYCFFVSNKQLIYLCITYVKKFFLGIFL